LRESSGATSRGPGAVRQARRAAESAGLADAGHITFGSDFPFAPLPVRKYFADNLVDYDGLYEAKLDAINRTNVLSLFSAAGTK
jgi:hypothetical protein